MRQYIENIKRNNPLEDCQYYKDMLNNDRAIGNQGNTYKRK